MKKTLSLLLLSTIFSLGLVSCGEKPTSAADSAKPSASEPTSSEVSVVESSELLSESDAISSVEEDYGTVTIEDISVDFLEDVEIKPVFSMPDKQERLTYKFSSNAIRIISGKVHCVKAGATVEVTASSKHFSTTFTVTTVEDHGQVVIPNVYTWLSANGETYSPADFAPIFESDEYKEDLTYSYDETKLTIDTENMKITGLVEGSYDVRVVSRHFFTTFKVFVSTVDKTSTRYNVSNYTGHADTLATTFKNECNEDSTLFIGDSFFDYRWFWTDYKSNPNYAKLDINAFGISSTTSTDWEILHSRVLKNGTPKNIAIHIGTNDFYDDNKTVNETVSDIEKLFYILHENYPTVNLFYFGITQRANTKYQSEVNETNAMLKTFCEQRGWIKYVDTTSKFTPDMLKDGVHPKLEYYSIFVDELKKAGCEISERKDLTKIADFDTAMTDTISSSKNISYRGKNLTRNFILDGTINIKERETDTSKNGGHIQMNFGGSTRFLIWDYKCPGKFLNSVQYPGCGWPFPMSTNYVAWQEGGINIDFRLVVDETEAYLYVNDVLQAGLFNLDNANPSFVIGTEMCATTVKDMHALTKADDGDNYLTKYNELKADFSPYASFSNYFLTNGNPTLSDDIEDVERTKDQTVGTNPAELIYKKKKLYRNFALSGKMKISDKKEKGEIGAPGAHAVFYFADNYRTLLWDYNFTNKFINSVEFPSCGWPYPMSTNGFAYDKEGGTGLDVTFKLIVKDTDVYVYINDVFQTYLNVPSTAKNLRFTATSEGFTMKYYEMTAKTLADDEAEYNAILEEASTDMAKVAAGSKYYFNNPS